MWYLLNYIPPRGHSRAALPRVIDRYCAARRCGRIELFAPSFFTVDRREGAAPRRVERPLLYHYIFVRGEEADVKRLCATLPGFSFVIDHTGAARHITLPDAAMEAFRLAARMQGNRLECYSPADVDLYEGDRVEIVTGQFAGLSGTYLPRKGGRSGNIYVAVTQSLGTVVYDIPADCVRVIEFAPATRRPYDQMDAYIPRLLTMLSADGTAGLPETPDALSAAVIFTRRFGSVRLGNPKVDAKLQLMLHASYRLLGDLKEAARTLTRYRSLAANITNVWTRALSHLIFGLLDSDPEQMRLGRALIATSTSRLSSLQSTIASALTA